MRRTATLLLPAIFLMTPLPAQMDHAAHTGHPHPMALSSLALAQVDSGRKVLAGFDTPAKARAAGYIPVLGDIPLQGEHYVNRNLMRSGLFDVTKPTMLMFSSVNGAQTLMGAAYGYYVLQAAPDPSGFDGSSDMWHEHPLLAPPGTRLTMVHLWLSDAPDGPFAHDDSRLPFLSRGLTMPPVEWLTVEQLRSLALALAFGGVTGDRLVQGGDAMAAAVTSYRKRLDPLVLKLTAAQKASKKEQYLKAAVEAGKAGDQMIVTLGKTEPSAAGKEFVELLLKEILHHN